MGTSAEKRRRLKELSQGLLGQLPKKIDAGTEEIFFKPYASSFMSLDTFLTVFVYKKKKGSHKIFSEPVFGAEYKSALSVYWDPGSIEDSRKGNDLIFNKLVERYGDVPELGNVREIIDRFVVHAYTEIGSHVNLSTFQHKGVPGVMG